MRRLSSALAGMVVFSTMSMAAGLQDWQSPSVVEQNRYPMTATFDTGGM